MIDPAEPYNNLPQLPPRQEIETPEVFKKVISAHRELAELKGMGPLLPNQAVLVQSIGLQEARVSSEIENIVTTNDELYRSFADAGKMSDAYTKEVLRYNDALWHGYQELKESNRLLNLALFEEIVQHITQHDGGVRRLPGTVLKNPATNRIVYTPPEGDAQLRDHLDALSRFIYEDRTLDPLVKLALIHYQFEAIHPFHDGNGRTGRILNILYLVEAKLLEYPVLYLSRYIIENKLAYYEGLRKVTFEGAWVDWVLYILEAVKETARLTRTKITAILQLKADIADMVQTQKPRIYSNELIDILFEHPYCKIKFLEGMMSRQTASIYLQELEKIGVVTCIKRGREKYFINHAFLEVLKNH